MPKPKIQLGPDKPAVPIIAKKLNHTRTIDIPLSKRHQSDMTKFYAKATPAQKRSVSEVMADQYAQMFRQQGSKRTLTQTPDSKANIHGFDQGNKKGPHAWDGMRIDEVKGGSSPLSKAQQKPTFVTDRANKILRSFPGYKKHSNAEYGLAQGVKNTLKSGGSIHYGTINVRRTNKGIRITDKPLYRIMGQETGTVGGPVTVKRDPSLIAPQKPPAREFIPRDRVTGQRLVIDRRSVPGKVALTPGKAGSAKPVATMSVANKLGPGVKPDGLTKMLTGVVKILRRSLGGLIR